MGHRDRRAAYLCLWLFALAFGWIEAAVVVYLREVGARTGALRPAAALTNPQLLFVAVPETLLSLEMAREACTILVLASVGWLAGRRRADRSGAFLLAFGVWDITYYAVLWLVSGWPDSIRTWDVLFLIPSPWLAPVWAPGVVAILFVLVGSYLYWTPDRPRRYRWLDATVLLGSSGLVLAAFLARSDDVVDQRPPGDFPLALYWAGVALGMAWFTLVERRGVRVNAALGAGVSKHHPSTSW